MAQTLEQFGQTIKAKYPQYANLPDTDVAQRVIEKYPQYQSQITTEQPQQLEEKSGGFFDEPTFPAKEGGAETIPGNIARTIGNIPGSAARLGRAVVAPVNPFDIESPLNIGANIVKGVGAVKDIFTRGDFKQGVKDVGAGFAETAGKIGRGAMDIAKKVIQEPVKTASSIAKVGIEDPMLIPSLLYAPGRLAGKGDIISKTAAPVTKQLVPVGEALQRSAAKSVETQKRSFVQELISPYRTPTVKEAQVSRSVETGRGPFLKTKVTPTASEEISIREVMKIPGLKEGGSFQKNYNIIRDYNIVKAKQLEADVAANDFIIPKQEVLAALNRAKSVLSKSPLIVGDAELTANRLIEGAQNILNKHPGTGSGLLRARKEYDQWVLSQKPKAFDAKAENAFTIANRAVRDSLNETFDKNARNIATKQLREEQSAIYRALENVEVKAAKEADTFLGRIYEKIEKVLGTRDKLTQALGLAVGGGVFGAAILFAKPLSVTIGTGWVMYKAGKLVLKPQIRDILGRILKESRSKFPDADRKILQELLVPNAPLEDLLKKLK